MVAIAPGRLDRPGAARGEVEPPGPEELDACPFCAGREERTPPETLALPPREPPDSPGWGVRVVPNKYPAFEHHEVVVHTPRHVRSVAELSGAELDLVAAAWQARAAAFGSYVFALINEGAAAGGSLPHTHSQLVRLAEPPPASQDVVDRDRWSPVEERSGLVLACPWASRLPYECVVAPASPRQRAFSDELLAPALRLLADAVRRLRTLVGPVPLNAWLHDGPDWHLELLPRLTVPAGLELGAGIWVNVVPPEQAAQELRAGAK